MLTLCDLDLDAAELALVARECEIQTDSNPEALQGLAAALRLAKFAAFHWGTIETSELAPGDIYDLILKLGEIVKPKQNANGWRNDVVFFADFSTAMSADKIEHAMKQISWGFTGLHFENADEIYFAFERIRPFKDGNGRVGWLMWLIYHYMQTGVWLQELPPDFELLRNRYDHTSDR